MYAVRPSTAEEWRASSPRRPKTEATLSPLTAISMIVVLLSLWFATVMVLDRTSNQPDTATISALAIAGP
jgi:hypothetical protein